MTEQPSQCLDQLTALVVTSDSQYSDRFETILGNGVAVQRESSITAAIASLDDADCLVIEYALVEQDEHDRLDRISRREPTLPVVFLVDHLAESTAAVDAARTHRWADCVELDTSSAAIKRVGHRIQSLVERQRLDALSRRSLASVELAQDAIAIVTPDGEFEFVNRSFAMQFGYDRDELSKLSWQALFTDDSVERLETGAIPTVADGWRWTGTCTGRRKSGSTFTVRVRLGGPEDGSLVFVVETPAAGSGADETA